MTDKELLELAAKAAGMDLSDWLYIGQQGFGKIEKIQQTIFLKGDLWNPISDDGDALRLAVKLAEKGCYIEIDPRDLCTIVHISGCGECDNGAIDILERHNDSDQYIATKRAIVRAAAEIGKEIK